MSSNVRSWRVLVKSGWGGRNLWYHALCFSQVDNIESESICFRLLNCFDEICFGFLARLFIHVDWCVSVSCEIERGEILHTLPLVETNEIMLFWQIDSLKVCLYGHPIRTIELSVTGFPYAVVEAGDELILSEHIALNIADCLYRGRTIGWAFAEWQRGVHQEYDLMMEDVSGNDQLVGTKAIIQSLSVVQYKESQLLYDVVNCGVKAVDKGSEPQEIPRTRTHHRPEVSLNRYRWSPNTMRWSDRS